MSITSIFNKSLENLITKMLIIFPGDEDIIRKSLDVISQHNGSLTREDLLKKLSEI